MYIMVMIDDMDDMNDGFDGILCAGPTGCRAAAIPRFG